MSDVVTLTEAHEARKATDQAPAPPAAATHITPAPTPTAPSSRDSDRATPHDGFMGGEGPALRYRPARLNRKDFSGEATVRFRSIIEGCRPRRKCPESGHALYVWGSSEERCVPATHLVRESTFVTHPTGPSDSA